MRPRRDDTRKALTRIAADTIELRRLLGKELGPDGPLWGQWRDWINEGHASSPTDGGTRSPSPGSVTERRALAGDRIEHERTVVLQSIADAERALRHAMSLVAGHVRTEARCRCGRIKDRRAERCQACAVARSRTRTP